MVLRRNGFGDWAMAAKAPIIIRCTFDRVVLRRRSSSRDGSEGGTRVVSLRFRSADSTRVSLCRLRFDFRVDRRRNMLLIWLGCCCGLVASSTLPLPRSFPLGICLERLGLEYDLGGRGLSKDTS